jgi:nitroimidazol reductase NimA-like FMN-containing flavoprotein (pyridoxamine 5'-phosphate oxidase superfamily)
LDVEKIESELDRRVLAENSRREMQAYHHMVQGKFRELDETNRKLAELEAYFKKYLPEKV